MADKHTMIGQQDIYLFHEGTHFEVENMLGARPVFNSTGLLEGYYFAVWAPNATGVSLVGDWNGWNADAEPMTKLDDSGIWELYKEGVGIGWTYKFAIRTRDGKVTFKADPCARWSELRPATASRTWHDDYKWHDGIYRIKHNAQPDNQPMVIYEMHMGSWYRGENGEMLTYRQIADRLAAYLAQNGYTHVEFLPLAEHPFDGSWGYQVTGYYAPTSRYGTPEDLKYLVDTLHEKGIGVLMDWVPAHFPKDEQGLYRFDGTSLYEGDNSYLHRWGTMQFDLSRREVQSFLVSNALYWLGEFHFDGLRVDAVSCMLYLDYDREDGQWQPNQYGGKENLAAIDFFRKLNGTIKQYFPGAIMIAEESSDYAGITKSLASGGLGFTYKWNMGWMNDTLKYMECDPLFRSGNHNLVTFSMMYAYNENFILPLSHDECVHGKKALINKMSGDYWQKFDSYKAYLAYMFAHPGKKLLFMGDELAQFAEWKFYDDIEWELLRYETHRGVYNYVHDLILFYRNNPAFWAQDDSWNGFRWCNADDCNRSVLSFVRMGGGKTVLCVFNMVPTEYQDYWVGVPQGGRWKLVLTSNDVRYGGKSTACGEVFDADEYEMNNMAHRLRLTVPPMNAMFFELEDEQ